MTSSARRARQLLGGTALACMAALAAACGATSGLSAGPVKTVTVTASPVPSASTTTLAPTPAGAGSSASPSGAVTPTEADTFIADEQDASGTAFHRPGCQSGCVLSGDGTSTLYAMAWSRWTGTEATGTGTENIESCTPDCASGGQYRVPVIVTFSQPVKYCPAGSGPRWLWSLASFTYPQGLPKALQGASAPANPWKFMSLIRAASQSCS